MTTRAPPGRRACDAEPVTQHVLIVGVDGVRHDTLLEVATPHLDALTSRGFLAPVRVNDAGPTISGPSWSTIMTGVLATDHQVFGNQLSPNRLADHPDVVELARRQRPDLATFVAAGWLPLVAAESGGPLFAGGGWHPDGPQAHAVEEWRRADQQVTDKTVAFLTNHDGSHGSLVFSYLGGVDETGHTLGVGPVYRELIEACDTRLGALLAAVDRRAATEDWTVIVVTDHGHLDAGGHGGESELERTAWIAAAGAQVPTTAPAALEQADVAAHAVTVLGLEPASTAFFGRPFGTRE